MNFMEILGAVGIVAVIGFGIVGIYVWFLYRRIKARVDEIIERVIEKAEANMVGLDIEVDKDTYFCYNSEDKQFVCQGKTVGEIAVAFRQRYPTKTAYLAGGDPAVVEQFKTELVKLATDENSTSQ